MGSIRMTLQDLKSKKIAIVGMGINNRHLAEYLKARHIPFQVFDNWSSQDELTGKLDKFDIIFRTPGLPLLSHPIQQAQKRGVLVYSQTKLFFDLCPCKIIGVTGTKGKGTTATLTGRILESDGKTVFLGGNIGKDPFEFIDKLKPNDWVVLELSSFQLQDLHKSPHIAVVLKISPEHLDYHKDVREYIDAKKPIVAHQLAADFVVLNHDYDITLSFADYTRAQIVWNSTTQEVSPGCFVKDGKVWLNVAGTPPPPSLAKEGVKGELEIMPVSRVKLLGRFNLENVTASIAAAVAAGTTDPALIRKAVSEFEGLPHRLEFVAQVKGVKFYNDSFSTTPETAIAALTAFTDPVILIVGGSEKNADYHELAKAIAQSRLKAVIPIGITGPKIARLARESGFNGKIVDVEFKNMEDIVKRANEEAGAGDIILLSPASASFDMFANYKHRGEMFRKFVLRLSH